MSWKRIGQSNTYEAHLAHKSLRRHAAGKKMTAAGRRAMLNMSYSASTCSAAATNNLTTIAVAQLK